MYYSVRSFGRSNKTVHYHIVTDRAVPSSVVVVVGDSASLIGRGSGWELSRQRTYRHMAVTGVKGVRQTQHTRRRRQQYEGIVLVVRPSVRPGVRRAAGVYCVRFD